MVEILDVPLQDVESPTVDIDFDDSESLIAGYGGSSLPSRSIMELEEEEEINRVCCFKIKKGKIDDLSRLEVERQRIDLQWLQQSGTSKAFAYIFHYTFFGSSALISSIVASLLLILLLLNACIVLPFVLCIGAVNFELVKPVYFFLMSPSWIPLCLYMIIILHYELLIAVIYHIVSPGWTPLKISLFVWSGLNVFFRDFPGMLTIFYRWGNVKNIFDALEIFLRSMVSKEMDIIFFTFMRPMGLREVEKMLPWSEEIMEPYFCTLRNVRTQMEKMDHVSNKHSEKLGEEKTAVSEEKNEEESKEEIGEENAAVAEEKNEEESKEIAPYDPVSDIQKALEALSEPQLLVRRYIILLGCAAIGIFCYITLDYFMKENGTIMCKPKLEGDICVLELQDECCEILQHTDDIIGLLARLGGVGISVFGAVRYMALSLLAHFAFKDELEKPNPMKRQHTFIATF